MINPRQLKQAMRQMGMEQEELDATQVLIRLADKEIVISQPSVQRVRVMGQESFQVSGSIEERSLKQAISADDVKTVVDQTGASDDDAKKALEDNDGDIAKAILALQR